jgi:hypothetical protein
MDVMDKRASALDMLQADVFLAYLVPAAYVSEIYAWAAYR